jgi:hypothetical protein
VAELVGAIKQSTKTAQVSPVTFQTRTLRAHSTYLTTNAPPLSLLPNTTSVLEVPATNPSRGSPPESQPSFEKTLLDPSTIFSDDRASHVAAAAKLTPSLTKRLGGPGRLRVMSREAKPFYLSAYAGKRAV